MDLPRVRAGMPHPHVQNLYIFLLLDFFLTITVYEELAGGKGDLWSRVFVHSVEHYTFTSTLFDLVVLALFRTVFLAVVFGWLKQTHKAYLVWHTIATSGFLIVKSAMFDWSQTSWLAQLLIVGTFISTFVETWLTNNLIMQRKHVEAVRRARALQGAGETTESVVDEETPLMKEYPRIASSIQATVVAPIHEVLSESDEDEEYHDAIETPERVGITASSLASFMTAQPKALRQQIVPDVHPRLKEFLQLALPLDVRNAMVGYVCDPSHPHKQAIDVAYQRLDQMTKSKEWTFLDERDGVVVHRLDGDVAAFRGVGVIEAFPLHILGVLSNVPTRGEWDPLFDYGRTIENYEDGHARLMHLSFVKPAIGVSARDLCLIVCWRLNNDGSIIAASCSVEDDRQPEVAGSVRAELQVAGYLLHPLSPAHDEMLGLDLAALNLKGWIPTGIVNMVLAKQPLSVAGLRKYVMALKKKGELESTGVM